MFRNFLVEETPEMSPLVARLDASRHTPLLMLDGARDKKQVWCPDVRTSHRSEVNLSY